MQKEYKLDETNERHSKHLCLGRVVICAKHSDFGIVYQYSDEKNASECSDSRLYIFNKDVNLDIPSKTIITFLKDFDSIKKGIYEVSDILPLRDYKEYVITSKEEKEEYDSSSMTGEMQRMMSNAEKFIVVSQDDDFLDGKLYFPIINATLRTVKYYEASYFDHTWPFTVLGKYSFILANKEYLDYPNAATIKNKLCEIVDYVSSLDLNQVLDSYTVYEGGFFQRRPGRDDHFLYTKNRICSSKDIYLNQLTKLGSEITDCDSCNGGSDDDDFSHLNVDETNSLRAEIREKYNTGEHLIYLISNYISKIDKIHKDTVEILNFFTNSIKKEDEFIFEQKFNSYLQWNEFITEFNKSKKDWYNF